MTFLTWGENVRVDVSNTPRCVCSCVLGTSAVETCSGDGRGGVDVAFAWIDEYADLEPLNWPPTEFAHVEQDVRSFRSSVGVQVGTRSFPTAVSSAKRKRSQYRTALARLLTYSTNSIGPRWDPWGTPECSFRWLDVARPILTSIDLLNR